MPTKDMVEEHESWELVGIYADEGISGTSLQHRIEFNRLIADCEAGKIDLIITKSISRFARNTVDSLLTQRKLANMKPPVAVYFIENVTFGGECTFRGWEPILIMILEERAFRHILKNVLN